MATIIRKETRKRGAMGWFFLVLFIGFNLLMLASMISGANSTSQMASGFTSDAERAGAAIGATMGFGLLLMIWALGDIILGIFVLLTRGSKILVETQSPS